MDHDDMNLLEDEKNNSKSKLPHHTFIEGEWIWVDGEWKRAKGGNRVSALLVHEAAKLGLYPPTERLKFVARVHWIRADSGVLYPTSLGVSLSGLWGKKGILTFTEE